MFPLIFTILFAATLIATGLVFIGSIPGGFAVFLIAIGVGILGHVAGLWVMA